MRRLLAACAVLLCAASAHAQEAAPAAIVVAPSEDHTRIVGPFADWLVLRTDREMTAQRSVAAGDVVMTAGVRHGRTARLTADAQLRGGAFGLGRRPPALPAGLGFFLLDDLHSRSFAIAGLRINAWCTPAWTDHDGMRREPFCLVYRESALATQEVQMVPAIMTNPLLVEGVNIANNGGWGPRPPLEETDVVFPGEMNARVEFLGAQGRNLAIQVTVDAHVDGYPDAALTFRREAPIVRDGSAYFDFAGNSDMQLMPVAGSSAYAVRFHGPFAAWLRQHTAP